MQDINEVESKHQFAQIWNFYSNKVYHTIWISCGSSDMCGGLLDRTTKIKDTVVRVTKVMRSRRTAISMLLEPYKNKNIKTSDIQKRVTFFFNLCFLIYFRNQSRISTSSFEDWIFPLWSALVIISIYGVKSGKFCLVPLFAKAPLDIIFASVTLGSRLS